MQLIKLLEKYENQCELLTVRNTLATSLLIVSDRISAGDHKWYLYYWRIESRGKQLCRQKDHIKQNHKKNIRWWMIITEYVK